MSMKRKLYVLTDSSLDDIYACVQGAHAVAQYVLEHDGDGKWRNDYLIFCKVSNLDDWISRFDMLEMKDYSIFREPDLGGRITAIAVVPVTMGMFRNLVPIGKKAAIAYS